MHSALYSGSIRHRRFKPVSNEFQYRIFFLFLDLDELEDVFDLHPSWSYEKFNLAAFHREDYLGDPRLPLKAAVKQAVYEQTGVSPQGPVRMLTHLRYFGFCFNPVTFYYCYDAAGSHVDFIVAEITNTPWLETHRYVIDSAKSGRPSKNWMRLQFNKQFHVSPFMDMDIRYDWRFRVPGRRLSVHMNNYTSDNKLFDASLSLERNKLSEVSLSKVLLRHPAMTWKVVLMIYWQALRLFIKGVPFYTHPSKR